jgi:hypothetical protein
MSFPSQVTAFIRSSLPSMHQVASYLTPPQMVTLASSPQLKGFAAGCALAPAAMLLGKQFGKATVSLMRFDGQRDGRFYIRLCPMIATAALIRLLDNSPSSFGCKVSMIAMSVLHGFISKHNMRRDNDENWTDKKKYCKYFSVACLGGTAAAVSAYVSFGPVYGPSIAVFLGAILTRTLTKALFK